MCDDEETEEEWVAVPVDPVRARWIDFAWWGIATARQFAETTTEQLDELLDIVNGHLNYRKAEEERREASREAAEAMGLLEGKEPR